RLPRGVGRDRAARGPGDGVGRARAAGRLRLPARRSHVDRAPRRPRLEPVGLSRGLEERPGYAGPLRTLAVEARHGFAAALRTLGVEARHGFAAARRALGVWGS